MEVEYLDLILRTVQDNSEIYSELPTNKRTTDIVDI